MWLSIKELVQNDEKEIKIDSLEDLNKFIPLLEEVNNCYEDSIRVCLPEAIYESLSYLMEHSFHSSSVTNYVRDVLLEHCYGSTTMQCLREYELELARRKKAMEDDEYPHVYNSVAHSLYKIRTKSLGKNDHTLKLNTSIKLKQDIKLLSEIEKISVSEYIRKVLIAHCLGNSFMGEIEFSEEYFKQKEIDNNNPNKSKLSTNFDNEIPL
ncbi:hypothetical protein A1D22_07620 [Pasteurellaceae bacterium LFhippo2]|nr:hypothetical protein [Pasteurellaceae bacterium LFhippo2]